MKKNVLVFGLISGSIISVFMALSMANCFGSNHFGTSSMVIGFTAMIVAFAFVFVGIKNQRDKLNGGLISFGQAFMTGLWITLIASTMYVITWMFEFHYFMPDFMDKYSAIMIEQTKSSGLPPDQLQVELDKITMMQENYKSPFYRIMYTYVEIFPVGLIITLISALILKRKEKNPVEVSVA
jgi:hypothetical protein